MKTKEPSQFAKDFTRGYTCALANIVRNHGLDVEVRDALICNVSSLKELRRHGVEEDDIKILMPHIKEIERRNKLNI